MQTDANQINIRLIYPSKSTIWVEKSENREVKEVPRSTTVANSYDFVRSLKETK